MDTEEITETINEMQYDTIDEFLDFNISVWNNYFRHKHLQYKFLQMITIKYFYCFFKRNFFNMTKNGNFTNTNINAKSVIKALEQIENQTLPAI